MFIRKTYIGLQVDKTLIKIYELDNSDYILENDGSR